ncbi:MAG: hypothetical protein WBZ20_13140 [Nitrososphaeraceae archaeon]
MVQILEVNKPCLKCGRPGVEKYGKTLPDKGILIKVSHEDRSVCEFEEYPSVTSFFYRNKTRKRDPKITDCPVCGQKGLIANYRPSKDKQFHKWTYYIVHEPIECFWVRTIRSRNAEGAT